MYKYVLFARQGGSYAGVEQELCGRGAFGRVFPGYSGRDRLLTGWFLMNSLGGGLAAGESRRYQKDQGGGGD